MAKIILKNASLCVSPSLTKVQRTYSGDTPLITFFIESGTLNPPAVGGTIMFQRFNGSSWVNLQGFPYTSYQFTWTIGSDGVGSTLNLGTQLRFRLTTPDCGEGFSNASSLVL